MRDYIKINPTSDTIKKKKTDSTLLVCDIAKFT